MNREACKRENAILLIYICIYIFVIFDIIIFNNIVTQAPADFLKIITVILYCIPNGKEFSIISKICKTHAEFCPEGNHARHSGKGV